jgi:hypothetical protein
MRVPLICVAGSLGTVLLSPARNGSLVPERSRSGPGRRPGIPLTMMQGVDLRVLLIDRG